MHILNDLWIFISVDERIYKELRWECDMIAVDMDGTLVGLEGR